MLQQNGATAQIADTHGSQPLVSAPPVRQMSWAQQPSSRPLQASAEAAVVGEHASAPPSHTVVPAAHTPGLPVSQARRGER